MNVEIINEQQANKLFELWGIASSVCYDTQTNTPEKIGKACLKSGHFSGSRGQYIVFKVTDCPRFVIDQAVRHEVGVFKNVQSFRYVDKDNFAYEVPEEILDDEELVGLYLSHMNNTIALYEAIQSYVKIDKGLSNERANEQARYVLPMATHGAFVIGFTIEALIHYFNTRLCVRTEDKHRELAMKMRDEVTKIFPQYANLFVPNCQAKLYCPEGKHGCGAYPSRDEVKKILSERLYNE